MSGSAVASPPTVIPERVTVDSDLVIEAVAQIYASSSLLSHLDYGDVAEMILGPADKLERIAFDAVGIEREDDDPVIVAVQARADELAAEMLSLCGGSLNKVAESYRLSAQKTRENGTI